MAADAAQIANGRQMTRSPLVLLLASVLGLQGRDVAGQPVVAFPSPLPGESAYFGQAVAGVGGNLLVGAPAASGSLGAAYLFDGTNRVLLRTFTPPGAATSFGFAVAPFGTNVLVGAITGFQGPGEAYLFDASTGGLLQTFPNPTPGTFDFFGWSLSAVGTAVVVGAPRDDTAVPDAGAAYLFDGATGTLLQTFLPPNPVGCDEFGISVAAYGNDVLVGAPVHGISPTFIACTPPTGPDVGAAYLFDGTTGALLQTFVPPAGAAPNFGLSVAALGTEVLVGAAGAIYVYDASTGQLSRSFTGSFGPAMASMGANIVTAGTGVAFSPALYVLDGATGVILRTFASPSGAASLFGVSVSVLGSNAVVGAPVFGHDEAAFLYCGGSVGCAPCETCGPGGSCVAAPHPTCSVPVGSRPTYLQVDNTAGDTVDRILWRGVAWPFVDGDFGEPEIVHDYTFCLYDESLSPPNLLFQARAPAGGTCGTRSCWKALDRYPTTAFAYTDTERTPDGLTTLQLRHTGDQARIGVKGKGALLSNRSFGLPTPPLGLPLRAQLQATDGFCWERRYATAAPNTAGHFKAAGD